MCGPDTGVRNCVQGPEDLVSDLLVLSEVWFMGLIQGAHAGRATLKMFSMDPNTL